MNGTNKSTLITMANITLVIRLTMVQCTLLVCIGCSGGLPASKYVSYMEKNNKRYCTELTRNGIVAKIAYLPAQYLAARDMAFDSGITKEKATARYDSTVYIRFSLQPESEFRVGADNLWKERSRQLEERKASRKKDFFILVGMDTVFLSGLRYDKSFGMVSEDAFLLSFRSAKIHEHKHNARLVLRNTFTEIGTLEIPLKTILKPAPALKG